MEQSQPPFSAGQGFCSSCGQRIQANDRFCPSCGTAIGTVRTSRPASIEPVYLDFEGTGLQALGWGVLAFFLSILVIPAGWGLAAVTRWFVANIRSSDGTEAQFGGSGGQIWWYFPLLVFVTIPLSFIPFVGSILALLFASWIYLRIFRWFFEEIRQSNGVRLEFTGGYWPFLGWYLLSAISIYSIIGWAWVWAAWMRWMCRNISMGRKRVVFEGNGWDFLWRGILVLLGSIPIITYPWMAVWFTRWLIRNVVIQPVEA